LLRKFPRRQGAAAGRIPGRWRRRSTRRNMNSG